MVEAAGRFPASLQGWLGGLRRRSPGDWGLAVAALLALLTAAYVAGFVLGWGSLELRTKVTYALYLPLTFGPMLLAWRVSRRGALPAATRRAWWRLGVGLAGWFVANLGWLWFEAIRGTETPVVVDLVYLVGAGAMLGGLLALPGRRARARRGCGWPSTWAWWWPPRSWRCGTWCSARRPPRRRPTS